MNFKFTRFAYCITNTDETTIDNDLNLGLNTFKYANILPVRIQFELFWNNKEFMVLFKRWSTNFNVDIANSNNITFLKNRAKLLGGKVADGANGKT